MAPLVWLVTGCTSGIGLALVNGIVARGDQVIATGRDMATPSLPILRTPPSPPSPSWPPSPTCEPPRPIPTINILYVVFDEGLQKEIDPLGLRSVIFEPGGLQTRLPEGREGDPFGRPPKIDDYLPLFGKTFAGDALAKGVPGDLTKVSDAIIDVVKGEGLAKGWPLPLRVLLGSDSLDAIHQKLNDQLQLIDTWEDVTLSILAQGRRETGHWLLEKCSI
ncbi:hypothetical protein QBC43DRAFT_361154 [Cladorrhinum sp. PSN259]|nr:hypothetical protein QBC43DRAFT_361154 [Cladorrhinum sp. PSN259]